MYKYILVSDLGGSLSVLFIWIVDPDIDDKEDGESRDPYTFSSYARAYTEHGIPLKEGRYPWGDDGDLFPYSEELLLRLQTFAADDDFEGYRALFTEEVQYMPGINYEED